MRRSTSHVAVLAACLLAAIACGEDLSVPPQKIAGGEPGRMMHGYLMHQVDRAASRWRAAYEARQTPEEIAAYQRRRRDQVLSALGGLPERTPLESKTLGVVVRPGYRVEKVLFQSQPHHYVTALLFLPDSPQFAAPYPGVLVPCGHFLAAKGHVEYQSIGALLALHGMAALVFDPIDQGERGQYFGEGGWPDLSLCAGHTMVGLGCVLLGQNAARFEIWDGMRAIDYLQSRPEIDPRRIGCTGNSGGGTQTCYLTALDDRIGCAAPSCYLTTLPRLLATFGVPDAEQSLFGQLAWDMDHADWMMMRAPAPILVCAATKDAIDIRGTWDCFRDAKRFYTRLGCSERVDILEEDAGHSYGVLQREAVVRWMLRWLGGGERAVAEPTIALLDEAESRCLPSGQVMTLPGARSVYDLNEAFENACAERRASLWAAGDRAAKLDQVRRIVGVRAMADLPEPAVESFGIVARAAYSIERLLIAPEQGISLPALFFAPEHGTPNGAVLYVHEEGKAADAAPGGPIEQRVRAGQAVLAVDLRGAGQTRSTSAGFDSPEYQDGYVAYLLGRSYVGMRTEDVIVCGRYLSRRACERSGAGVHLVAIGNVGVPALHAAALEPSLFQTVHLTRTLVSWSNVLHSRIHKGQEMNIVHGALTYYDLPDLAATLGGRLTIADPVNAVGATVQD